MKIAIYTSLLLALISFLALLFYVPQEHTAPDVVNSPPPLVLIEPVEEAPAPVEEDIPESMAVLPEWNRENAPNIIWHFASEYGASAPEMNRTIECESGFKPTAWNQNDPYGGSRGVAQFLQDTFDRYVVFTDIEDPDVWNPYHAVEVMAYMFSIGEAKQWSCWRMIYQ